MTVFDTELTGRKLSLFCVVRIRFSLRSIPPSSCSKERKRGVERQYGGVFCMVCVLVRGRGRYVIKRGIENSSGLRKVETYTPIHICKSLFA